MKMIRIALVLALTGAMHTANPETGPETVTLGPNSGIVLREIAGLLITNCQTYTQRVYVKLDPLDVYRKFIDSKAGWKHGLGYAAARWASDSVSHARSDITHILQQLEKFTITQSELEGHSRREKRFITTLLSAAAAMGALFSIGSSTVNAVSIHTVQRHVSALEAEIPAIREQLRVQAETLQTVGKTLEGTITVVNSHSVALNRTYQMLRKLEGVVEGDYAQAQIIAMLMADMLREVGASIENLAIGRIPPYLISVSLVESIIASATRGSVLPIQTHLAYTLGSATPLSVDPVTHEIGFLLSLPIIDNQNIYRLKSVVNVGFWNNGVFMKLTTPPVIAYHDSNPSLYLVPNLRLCTVTKSVNYICPNKPFLTDTTDGICGLKPMVDNSRCAATASPLREATATSAEIVGNRWLVNTPESIAELRYANHDVITRISLPRAPLWVDVPRDATLHVADLALYHLSTETYNVEVEVADFFRTHTFEIDPKLKTQIEVEGTQRISLTPLDNALKALNTESQKPLEPLLANWSSSDNLIIGLIVSSYLFTLAVAIALFKRGRRLETQYSRCLLACPGLTRNRDRTQGKADTVDRCEEIYQVAQDHISVGTADLEV